MNNTISKCIWLAVSLLFAYYISIQNSNAQKAMLLRMENWYLLKRTLGLVASKEISGKSLKISWLMESSGHNIKIQTKIHHSKICSCGFKFQNDFLCILWKDGPLNAHLSKSRPINNILKLNTCVCSALKIGWNSKSQFHLLLPHYSIAFNDERFPFCSSYHAFYNLHRNGFPTRSICIYIEDKFITCSGDGMSPTFRLQFYFDGKKNHFHWINKNKNHFWQRNQKENKFFGWKIFGSHCPWLNNFDEFGIHCEWTKGIEKFKH